MLINIKFVSIFILTFGLNVIFNKINFLKDKKNFFKHKNLISKNITPVFSGGLLLIITILIFIPVEFYILKLFLFLVFLIGFFSDLNILKSPNLRFLTQVLTVLTFLIIFEINISSIRIEKADVFLENYFFNLFFTSLCILIVINGTNFIDGVNTSVIGYYLILLIALSNLMQIFGSNIISLEDLNLIIFCLFCLFILNFFELLYLGDNGAYLVSLFAGILLIEITNQNELISPYYVVNLLWYPAYEILFSIIRKIKNKKSVFEPDNFHLHQLLYLFISSRFKIKKISNTLTGCLINLYQLVFVFFISIDYSNTKYQVTMIFLSTLIYTISYLILKKINYKSRP
jgi:UDP-N-acetylmuramyl pentapeptide phosphotransferase/UDP-N-acetylglucosamine-1-phosphate transferase